MDPTKITTDLFKEAEYLKYEVSVEDGEFDHDRVNLQTYLSVLHGKLMDFMELVQNNELQIYNSKGERIKDFGLDHPSINSVKILYHYENEEWDEINKMLENKDLIFNKEELEQNEELINMIENAGLKLVSGREVERF